MSEGRRETETVLSQGGGAPPDQGGRVAPGEVVAGYTVDEVAGAGGMGVVYRASDPELGRTVALKLIAPARSDDPRLRDLFVDESLTAAGLEHPNVIPIYRAGEDHGRLYIAMRFVEGSSLQELIGAAPGGLPPGRAARIVARVADALDAAHARGLVHRDVKPGNILIADPEGEEHVYLTDFGLTVRGAGPIGLGAEGWAGTLAYLAPEQIRGGALDARTDVYALGCVLFHSLTGRPPFPTDDEEAALTAHLTQRPPAPSELVPGLPPAMDEVVRRAMAKRPEDRFQSAGELGRAALAARYDAAVLACEDDLGAAQALAAGLAEEGLHPFLAVSGDAQATAEGVRASGGCAVLVGRGGLGDWAREGLAAASELAARDRAFRLVLVLLPGAPDPADASLAFLATHPWVDLRAGASDALAAQDIARALRGDVPPGLGGAPSDACPYRGLEAFREEDAGLYFGREQDTASLVQRLRSTRFLAVLGASGSGKSSLVQAGLMPAVRRGDLPSGESWRVLDLVPGARPLAALAARLAQLPGAGAPSASDLGADERALDLALARALDGRPAGGRVLVAVDQLEEAFTLCPDEGERAAFLSNLVYAATIPGGRAVVVVAMRSDFYHRLAEHPEMRALAAAQQVLVGPMDARGLRRAIEEPARRAGLELEPGLTRRILTDVADRPGTLPLLEYLLLELWQRRRGRTLTLEAYAASGGVEGALARRANAVYGAMSPERQALARRVLLRLTVPGEGTEDTRRRAPMRELVTRPGEETEVEAVVGALAEARLLTTGRDEATGEPAVDVTHEALIRGWPELRGWINDDRDQLRQHRRLSDAAAEWDASGRDEGQLYRGARLATWQERDRSDLNELERDFLAASQERAERERATRRKRVKIGVGALAAVLVIVAGLAIFAFVSRGEAADERDASRSRELAANANLQMEGDPELGLLLAQEAYAVDQTDEAEEMLRQATAASAVRAADRGHQGPAWDVATSADGTTVASAGADGTIRLWRPEGDSAARVLRGHDGEVRGVALSPDGATVAGAGADGTVRVWSGSDLEPRVLRGHDGVVNSVAFNGDGTAVVSAGDDGTVRVWPLGDGERLVLRGHEGIVRKAAFAPDGRIASGGDDGVVRLWSPAGRPGATFTGHAGNPVYGVAVAPDGRVASASVDLTARVWTPGSSEPALVLKAAGFSGVDDVAFSEDGRLLVTSGQDGTVRVWDSAGRRLATLRGHDGEVLSARFVAGGDQVASSGFDGTARVWDWRQGLPDAEVSSDVSLIYEGGATFTPDGERVLSGLLDGSIRSWTPGGPAPATLVPPGPAATVGTAMALSPDGTRAALADFDGVPAVHELASPGSQPTLLRGHEGPVWSMAFDPPGQRLVTGGGDGTVRIWDLATGRGRVLGRYGDTVLAVSSSPDGARVTAAGVGGAIRIWSVEGSAASTDLAGHQGVVSTLGFSPDGRRLASGGSDRTVRVWDLETGRSTVLGKHETAVNTATFSPDGSYVLSTASDGTRVWDWARGIVVFQEPEPARNGYRAAFSPDGRRIVVSRIDDSVRVVTCETCGPIDEVLTLAERRVTRELTSEEQQAFGG